MNLFSEWVHYITNKLRLGAHNLFFFSLTYKKPLQEVEKFLSEHNQYLETFYKEGIAEYNIIGFQLKKMNEMFKQIVSH